MSKKHTGADIANNPYTLITETLSHKAQKAFPLWQEEDGSKGSDGFLSRSAPDIRL